MNAAPQIVHLPTVFRTVDQIAPGLRDQIKALVNGLEPWPLFMHGSPGTGKTCASLCLLDRCHKIDRLVAKERKTADGRTYTDEAAGWIQDEPSGIYRTSSEVCDEVMAIIRRKALLDGFWATWGAARLAVLDELGSREKVGDFIYNTTKQLIDSRAGKPLIVISNLDLPTLAKLYDDRLTSRLAAGTVIEVTGKDRRVP